MSYTRFITPDPIGPFNASHTDEEIRTWQAEQIAAETKQLELDLTDANVHPASTTDFEKNSAPSEQPTELDSTQSA
jgi:hypothetical protein